MKSNLILIFFGIMVTISCDTINSCGPFPDRFKVENIEFSLQKVKQTAGHYEASNILLDTMLYNELGIRSILNTKTYFSQINLQTPVSIFSTAYACSPKEPVTEETLQNLEIVSKQDFNEKYRAGDNLVNIFDVVLPDINDPYTKSIVISLKDYLDQKPYVSSILLLLNTAPSKTGEFQFTIKWYQDGVDNDFFQGDTQKIVISN